MVDGFSIIKRFIRVNIFHATCKLPTASLYTTFGIFSTGMRSKDYYRILETRPSASMQEIKQAYRRLVLKYHPDKNPDNHLAASHFLEIQEAYEILSDTERRIRYNHERWYSPGFVRNPEVAPTPLTILLESRKFKKHVDRIDVFRMDHEALQFHLLQLLSPMHLTILTVEPEAGINQEMIRNCLHMMRFLKLNATIPVIQQLKTLAGNDPVHLQLIENFERSRKQDQVWYKLRPYLVAVVTILICILIFFLSRG